MASLCYLCHEHAISPWLYSPRISKHIQQSSKLQRTSIQKTVVIIWLRRQIQTLIHRDSEDFRYSDCQPAVNAILFFFFWDDSFIKIKLAVSLFFLHGCRLRSKELLYRSDFLDVSERWTIPDRYEWNMKCLGSPDYPKQHLSFAVQTALCSFNVADMHGKKCKKKVNASM